MNRRLVYSILTAIFFTACVIIVMFFSGNHFIRGFVGDIIVISLLYFFIRIFRDIHPLKLAAVILSVAFLTEFLQYLKLASYLGLEHNRLAVLIFGSVFDPKDLAAYVIGTVLAYFLDTKLVSRVI